MALLQNGSVSKGVIRDGTVSSSFSPPYGIFWRVIGPQENNIILLGVIQVYVRVINSEVDEFFSHEQYEMRARRGIYKPSYAVGNGAIVRLVPLYDFSNVQIWISNSGVP